MSQPNDWNDRDTLRKYEPVEEIVKPVMCHWCGCHDVQKIVDVCDECEQSEDYKVSIIRQDADLKWDAVTSGFVKFDQV